MQDIPCKICDISHLSSFAVRGVMIGDSNLLVHFHVSLLKNKQIIKNKSLINDNNNNNKKFKNLKKT